MIYKVQHAQIENNFLFFFKNSYARQTTKRLFWSDSYEDIIKNKTENYSNAKPLE